MPNEPRLRGTSGAHSVAWQIGQIPADVIHELGRQLTGKIAVGNKDLSGNEFGEIFATAIGGKHLSTPLGLADVVLSDCSWSVKTVKDKQPTKKLKVRLISGRNSPDFSFNIQNPHDDLRQTGEAVLAIWNSRLNATRNLYDDVRVVVLIRNMLTQEFVIFEEEVSRYVPGSAISFKINHKVQTVPFDQLMEIIKFSKDWICID